jgi:hypothetical protein
VQCGLNPKVGGELLLSAVGSAIRDEIPLRVRAFHTLLFITRAKLFPRTHSHDVWTVFKLQYFTEVLLL